MFNSQKPNLDELPSSSQLIKSTLLTAITSAVLLVTVILPAEYAIDPTGAGNALGLTEMGEIKKELEVEAEEDRQKHSSSTIPSLFSFFVSSAQAQEVWKDTITFTLAPSESAEVKLVMKANETAEYSWKADGGRINYDLHAHGDGKSIDYDRGRGKTSSEGKIKAPFAGEHGWFWRNRDKVDVTITLQLRGAYGDILRGD